MLYYGLMLYTFFNIVYFFQYCILFSDVENITIVIFTSSIMYTIFNNVYFLLCVVRCNQYDYTYYSNTFLLFFMMLSNTFLGVLYWYFLYFLFFEHMFNFLSFFYVFLFFCLFFLFFVEYFIMGFQYLNICSTIEIYMFMNVLSLY